MRTLVLWDIDRTLIDIGGLTADIYAEVFRSVTGLSMVHQVPTAGRTDLAIITETLRLHDITASEGILRIFTEELAAAFATRNGDGDLVRRGRSLPGAVAALRTLASTPRVIQSVVTGNMQPIAVGKLTAFGMDRFIDFEVGAYGLDDSARPPLVRLARQRASTKYGTTFTVSNTAIVGDTPDDVLAGHQGGARVIAVATGGTDLKGLRAAGAELVLPDLIDTDTVVRAILGRATSS